MRSCASGYHYKIYPHQLDRQRVEKQHHLILQPIFSEASQTEWREPFDFPTGISGFPVKMVSTPRFPNGISERKMRLPFAIRNQFQASCELLSNNFEGGFVHSKVRPELIDCIRRHHNLTKTNNSLQISLHESCSG